ncbi:MAG: hypothetical protein ACKV2T_38215 [Kofleriaceae bacterium]
MSAIESVLGVKIQVPAEAIVPIIIGCVALAILIFSGSALASWKERNPAPARIFGMVVGSICMIISIYFLSRCLLNQIDPNSDAPGAKLEFLDPPLAAFMAAIGALFWRMGDQPKVALGIGIVVGGIMIAKPFIWPVIVAYSESYGDRGTYSRERGMLDPEHAEFIGSGIVVLVTGLIAGLKARATPAPRKGHPFPNHPDHVA